MKLSKARRGSLSPWRGRGHRRGWRLTQPLGRSELAAVRALTKRMSQPTERDPALVRFSEQARLFLTLSLGTASLLLTALLTASGASPVDLITSNKIPLKARLVTLGVSWGLAVVAGGAGLAAHHKAKVPSQFAQRWQALAAPCALSVFIPLLYAAQIWRGREVAFLAFCLSFGFALERTLAPARDAFLTFAGGARLGRLIARPPVALSRVLLLVVVAAAAFYFARIGYLTNISHKKLLTSSSDLAEYNNLFFNALHGHPFRAPAIAAKMADWNTLQGHAELCLYLLLPFYAISPGPHALLWIQSGLVGFAAIPIYLFARRRLGPFWALAFPAAHLMMPAVQQPNFYDFHFPAAAAFFSAWMLFFVQELSFEGKTWARVGTYVAMAGALSCREDISFGVAALGLFLILRGVLVRDGIKIFVAGCAYLVIMKFGIMPLFGQWWFDNQWEDLKAEGAGGFGSVILTLLSNQAFVLKTIWNEPKALYVLHMTAPVLALWLRRPILLLAVLPGLITTLLCTNRPPLFQASFQYTYLWVPYVLCAAALAIKKRDRAATAIPILLIALGLDHQLGVLLGGKQIMGGFGMKDLTYKEADEKRLGELRSLIAMIPPHASVAATEAEGPHVSTRLVMFSLKFSLGHDPEYLLVGNVGVRDEGPHIRQALETGKYGVVAQKGIWVLAKRGASPAKNNVLWRKVGGRRRS